MTLGQIGINKFHFLYSNLGAPSDTPGTSVTPGASHAEGSWTEIASSANIAKEIYSFIIGIANGATSGQQKDHALDIGVDPAGGTSYTAIISDILCGGSPSYAGAQGPKFFFPYRISAGSSVAVRIQGSNATAGTVRVFATFFGDPGRPEYIRFGRYAETIGTLTNTQGVSFTPGTNAKGSWASLGTTTRPLWWWQLSIQCSNANIGNNSLFFDMAYGDETNKHLLVENMDVRTANTEELRYRSVIDVIDGFTDVPAGATIYVRGHDSSTPDSGWNALAHGIGG